MIDKHVQYLMQELSKRKINSTSLNELFQLDGAPIWYFLESFMGWHLPKPFRPYWEIAEDIKRSRSPSWLDNLQSKLAILVLRKGLVTNEKIKYIISRLDKKNTKNRKQDVLFIASTDRIIKKDKKLEFSEFGKIVESLEKKRIKPLILICDPFSRISLFRLRKYNQLVYRYITPEIIKESRRMSNELHKKWKNIDEKTKEKLFSWGKKSRWSFYRGNFDLLFSKEVLFTLAKYHLTFKRIFQVHDIKVAYSTSFSGFYGSATLGAAYKLEKKIVHSPHGYTSGINGEWGFMKNVFFAVRSVEEKNRFLEKGTKKEKIVVTGPPFSGEIANYQKRKPKTKTVLLLTTSLIENKQIEKDRYFELMRRTLAQIKSVEGIGRLVIRLHPNEKHHKKYKSIVKSLKMKDVVIHYRQGSRIPFSPPPPEEHTLHSDIINSDLVIGFGSTALETAIFMNKYAIHLDEFIKNWLEIAPEFLETTLIKETLRVKNIDNLAKNIRKVLTDESQQEKLKLGRKRHLQNGKVHMRVADLIEHVVKRH